MLREEWRELDLVWVQTQVALLSAPVHGLQRQPRAPVVGQVAEDPMGVPLGTILRLRGGDKGRGGNGASAMLATGEPIECRGVAAGSGVGWTGGDTISAAAWRTGEEGSGIESGSDEGALVSARGAAAGVDSAEGSGFDACCDIGGAGDEGRVLAAVELPEGSPIANLAFNRSSSVIPLPAAAFVPAVLPAGDSSRPVLRLVACCSGGVVGKCVLWAARLLRMLVRADSASWEGVPLGEPEPLLSRLAVL